MRISEKVLEKFCDGYCWYARELHDQDMLDDICDKCPLRDIEDTTREDDDNEK